MRHEVRAPDASGRQPWRNACTDTENRVLRDRAFVGLVAVLYPSLVPALGLAVAAFMALAFFLKL